MNELHFCHGKDLPLRFGVDRREKADRIVRTPEAHRSPVSDDGDMSPKRTGVPIQAKMNNRFLTLIGRWAPPGYRRLLCLFLVGVLAGTLPPGVMADRAEPDNTKTQFATPLPVPPEIDGVIDTVEWRSANGATGNWRISFNANQTNMVRGGVLIFGPDLLDATDLGCQMYAGYDTNNLYIAVRVTDNALYDDSVTAESANGKTEEDDSVELHIDPMNANAATNSPGSVGGRYAIALNNAYAGSQTATYGTDNAWYARASRNATDTGYDAEFRISMSSLSDPKFGDVLGFTVVVNDDKDAGPVEKTLDRQVAWVGAPNQPVTYGNLIIGHKAYAAPQVTNAPTVDGTIHTNEYSAARDIPINLRTGQPQTAAGVDAWPPGTFEATAWVTHDATAVYVAVDVIDTTVVTDTAEAGSEDGTTWEDDSVEIFFDADLDKNRGGPTVDFEGQFVLTANGAHRDAEARNPTFGETGDWYGATSLTSKGYQIEFKVNKTALLSPTNGTVMGFNIALNNDNGAGRIAQLSWNGDPHQEYTYGQLTLASAAPTELRITNWQRNANGTFTIEWVGGGVLQGATDVAKGPWVDVPTATSPYTFTPTERIQFERIIRR